ncbi:RNA polymerase subunit sigma-70 [Actinoplanes sp. NPDC051633]|uniref:RNA polymerase subunit sigma-70 n=1 Tax=Actinoplanes sp. NPDC051633 TaxID=3155670 RepID=UPI00344910C6
MPLLLGQPAEHVRQISSLRRHGGPDLIHVRPTTRRGETDRMDLEHFRVELTGYCYRMLGSGFEAEDAVQETFVRAWRSSYDDQRASLRTWLYRIATNVCLDMLRSAQRRALAIDLSPAASLGADLGEPAPDSAWVQPVPDLRVLPEDSAVMRESIRLAFIAALQHLPPKQRAVLILRDVLCWQASEVAELLDTSVASVTSALQRARAALPAVPGEALDSSQAELLERYCAAFESHDVPGLVALLHEDATMTMPPFVWWLQGSGDIAAAFATDACEGARLTPARANGSPAFWQLRDGRHFGLVVLDIRDNRIAGLTTYLNAAALLPLFSS